MQAATITIRKATLADADELLAFSKKTFYDFFGGLNDAVNIDAYAAVAFTSQKITDELANPNSHFYFALLDNQLAGYLKLNFGDAQTEFEDSNALEIERIYVSREHHGKQIGSQLLLFSIDAAVNMQLAYLWLGVWEHNHSAINFYRRHGFEEFGSHDFMLGNDRQTDLLMKKMI